MRYILLVICSLLCIKQVQPQTSAKISKLIETIEKNVTSLAIQAQESYKQRCEFFINCTCSYIYCPGYYSVDSSCKKNFGLGVTCNMSCDERHVDLEHSCVKYPAFTEGMPSLEIGKDDCWTKGMDEIFFKLYKEDNKTVMYIATTQGSFRTYPAMFFGTCSSYDPRMRPWYINAISGQKNVIIVMDISKLMSDFKRLEISKSVAKLIIDTLTINDYVSVVIFSNESKVLVDENIMLKASPEYKQSLINEIDKLTVNYTASNFEAGFNEAFNLLGKSKNLIPNCKTAIVFLTFGRVAEGLQDQNLTNYVNDRNSPYNATIFIYSIKKEADTVITKNIACASNGIWADIVDGQYIEQLVSYFNFFNDLFPTVSKPSWLEPYLDATGLGYVTTASMPFYDHSTGYPRLLGVVGIDIRISTFTDIDPDFTISTIIEKRDYCTKQTFDPCQLEHFRSLSAMGSEAVCNTLNCTVVIPLKDNCTGFDENKLQPYCNYNSSIKYEQEPCCCLDEAPAININTPNNTSTPSNVGIPDVAPANSISTPKITTSPEGIIIGVVVGVGVPILVVSILAYKYRDKIVKIVRLKMIPGR